MDVLEDRALSCLARRRALTPRLLHRLLAAREALALAFGLALGQIRDQPEPLARLLARLRELETLLAEAQHEADLLRQRLHRLDPRHRPHYNPYLRYRILLFMRAHALPLAETARRFLVTTNTLTRWIKEAAKDPRRESVGSLLKLIPPLRRYADAVRELIQEMDRMGFGGRRAIALSLLRFGWKLDPRTVGRVRRETPSARPPHEPATQPARPVQARYPNHLWLMDLTEIPALFRIFAFKLALVIDGFSRMPLAAKVFLAEPSAEALLSLVHEACRRHGKPRYFLTDHGSQFTAEVFRDHLRRIGIRQRFASLTSSRAISRIERLWRTLKDGLGLRSRKPLCLSDLERRLELGLIHYAYLRPHQTLEGATPAEAYFRIQPATTRAVHPPRGRPGETHIDLGVEILHLDPERRLPLLLHKAA